jgi:hypothetical protein
MLVSGVDWMVVVGCIAERSPPIEEVIAAGVVPRFVEFLVRGDFPQLQVMLCFTG